MSEAVKVKVRGRALLEDPFLNKSTAFSIEERKLFNLEGRLPHRIESLDEQVDRLYRQFSVHETPLEKYIFLRSIQDDNRVQYYALLKAHLEEMLPIVYTPTVGVAIQEYSLIYREPRGLIITEDNFKELDEILLGYSDTDLAVVTDAEGILGIGDQGFGGIAICMGKLSLYSLTAGISPARTLPVLMDFGTDNQQLLDDPFYLGVRKKRIRGDKYYEMIDVFTKAYAKRFPGALLQWEDLSKATAFEVLERHRHDLPSFNDDIQGTGATALAGLIAATNQGETLTQQRFLVSGAGAGGMGVALQIKLGLIRLGLTEDQARSQIFVLDSKGLILNDRKGLERYKLEFAHNRSVVEGWVLKGENPSLLETVEQAKITVLLGLSGQGGSFDQTIVKAMIANSPKPIIFALSNPTNLTEILPKDAICWSDGAVITATGSPFPSVDWKGKNYTIGQGNNTFVFPGIGWGVLASGAQTVNDEFLTDAAFALASQVTPERLAQGAVFPAISDLAAVNQCVAKAVAKSAHQLGLATKTIEETNAALEKHAWSPEYLPYELDD